jgi:hypothetical protein
MHAKAGELLLSFLQEQFNLWGRYNFVMYKFDS